MILGTLVSALSWLILALWSSYWGAVLSIFILALGEITQAPKYYEYISKLAPAEQQGTYMGFAFLPIGIGSIVGGWFGGGGGFGIPKRSTSPVAARRLFWRPLEPNAGPEWEVIK